MTIINSLSNIWLRRALRGSPLQGLFIKFLMISINIWAALPLKYAAEQQNICSELITRMCQSCIAAKY